MSDAAPDPRSFPTAGASGGLLGVAVETERETAHGWEFDVSLDHRGPGEGTRSERRTVTLSWADYELWCGGRKAPSVVAEAVARFASERGLLGRLGRKFDAATVRRMDPGVDRLLTDAL